MKEIRTLYDEILHTLLYNDAQTPYRYIEHYFSLDELRCFFQFVDDPTTHQALIEDALLLYISVKTHICASCLDSGYDYQPLSECVLLGDYYSGAFTHRIAQSGRLEHFSRWLLHLSRIQAGLVEDALKDKDVADKMERLCTGIYEAFVDIHGTSAIPFKNWMERMRSCIVLPCS